MKTDIDVSNALFWVARCMSVAKRLMETCLFCKKVLQSNQTTAVEMDTNCILIYENENINCDVEDISKANNEKKLFERALHIYQKFLLDEVTNDHEAEDINYCIGRCLLFLDKPKEAKEYFQTALRINETLSPDVKTDRDVANATKFIGRCLLNMNQPENAKTFFDKALKIEENLANDVTIDSNLAHTTFLIGRCMLDMKEPEAAKVYFEKSLKIKDILPYESTLFWIGRCLLDSNKVEEAKVIFDQTLLNLNRIIT